MCDEKKLSIAAPLPYVFARRFLRCAPTEEAKINEWSPSDASWFSHSVLS